MSVRSFRPSPQVLALAILAGGPVLAVAACGGSGQTSTPSPSAPPATVTATTTATSTETATSTSAATATATATGGSDAGARCTVDHLRIRYADDAGGGGAGSVMGTFTFTNTGTASCTLRGFPGVSFVTASAGSQIGAAATRTDDDISTTTLAAGKSATSPLRRTQPGNYGSSCQQTGAAGFRVYPPGSTEAAFVAFKTDACKSTKAPLLQVGPVG